MNRGGVCVGGHDLDDNFRSPRLLTKGGNNLAEDTDVAIGDVLEVSYSDHPDPGPPYVEDVLVQGASKREPFTPQQLKTTIIEHAKIWAGDPTALFDDTATGTPSGRVYVPDDIPVPSASTGYLIPDADLVKPSTSTSLRARRCCARRRRHWALDSHEHLPSDPLYAALTDIRGIRHWRASVAICDLRSDFGYW